MVPPPESHTPSHLQVVVDTSVLRRARGDISKGDWPALRAAARVGLLAPQLPSVVLQEAIDHRRRDLRQLVDLELKAAQLREELFSEPRAPWEPSRPRAVTTVQVEQQCARYAAELAAWFQEVGAVLRDPSVAHSELVERVLARRQPFNSGEKGYRDALIWYSTLECAETGPVILLTANTNDFGTRVNDRWQLGDDLVDDLRVRNLPPDRVRLVTSTTDLLQEVLPAWEPTGVSAAWSTYLRSGDGVRAIDALLNSRLGLELSSPPSEPPTFLWSIGLRALESVTDVDDIRLIGDADGWFHVRARVTGLGRLGGYVWSWGDPDRSLDDFTLWDEWGGLTEYVASNSLDRVYVMVAARFRPLLEVSGLELLEANVLDAPPGSGVTEGRKRVLRSLEGLLLMLTLYLDEPQFLDDVLGDRADEFILVLTGIMSEWEAIADGVPGRYPTLSTENLPTVATGAAGLRALRRDVHLATDALCALVGEPTKLGSASTGL